MTWWSAMSMEGVGIGAPLLVAQSPQILAFWGGFRPFRALDFPLADFEAIFEELIAPLVERN